MCDDCYMRLQRQATEWGKKYKFRLLKNWPFKKKLIGVLGRVLT